MQVADAADRERLLTYIWPDQAERLARIETAITVAAADPPTLDREDAASWIERHVEAQGQPGSVRVVTQQSICSHLERVGAAATNDVPLAWLQFEMGPRADEALGLTLRLWPGDGEPETLATASAHGQWVKWQMR